MPLKKTSGNMYDWVTHTHTHLGGECPHKCGYCSVQAMAKKYSNKYYQGPPRLVPNEFNIKYGEGRSIFLEHCNDIMAHGIDDEWIRAILLHAAEWPKNTYVFQSKTPYRFAEFLELLPDDCIIGTTLETNRVTGTGYAPDPVIRAEDLAALDVPSKFVTIEPIMDFDVDELVAMVKLIRPEFVNVGADSKGFNLPEPPAEKVLELLEALEGLVESRQKHNLERILKS